MRKRRNRRLFSWPGVLAGVLAVVQPLRAAPPSLDNLLQNSPFGGQFAPQAATRSEAPLEFRGVLTDAGEQFFSLYEAATHYSLWVRENEPGNPYMVRGYDGTTGVVTVEYQGRTLRLELKQAKIRPYVAPLPAVALTPPGGEPAASSPTPAAPLNTLAARRAANLAELNRRHQLSLAAEPGDRPAGGNAADK